MPETARVFELSGTWHTVVFKLRVISRFLKLSGTWHIELSCQQLPRSLNHPAHGTQWFLKLQVISRFLKLSGTWHSQRAIFLNPKPLFSCILNKSFILTVKKNQHW